MRRVLLFAAAAALVVASFAHVSRAEPPADPRKRPDLIAALKQIDAASLKENLFFLADASMEGRDTGSDGAHRAAMHIAEWHEKMGMIPKGTDGYFQPFGEPGKKGELKDACYLRLMKNPKAPPLEYERHFRPATFSGTGSVAGDLTFVGYGISAKELGYDDYAGQKVEGKIVVALDHEPQEQDPNSVFDGVKPTKYSDIRTKAETAKAKGAAALLVVRDLANHDDGKGYPEDDELGWPPTGEGLGLPVAYLSAEATSALCAAVGRKDFAGLQKNIDKTGKPSSMDLKGCPVRLRISATAPVIGGQKNIIAMKEGSDPELKNEYVVLSAHYDHIGLGTAQDALDGPGKIHPGSDDNASGTSGLLELAKALRELKTKRSLLLIHFDGEEAGLLGSKHFAGSPTVPMDRIVAILNMDMISRNKPAAIFVGGLERNDVLKRVLNTVSARYGLSMETDGMEQYIQRSDQWSLMEKGVPGIFFFGGMHGDYHRAGDTPEKANITKIKLITMVCLVFLDEVGNGESPRK